MAPRYLSSQVLGLSFAYSLCLANFVLCDVGVRVLYWCSFGSLAVNGRYLRGIGTMSTNEPSLDVIFDVDWKKRGMAYGFSILEGIEVVVEF